MILDIKNLNRVFKGPVETVTAVDNISLTMKKGEFVAIVGPSGCGKSTLLLAAGALLRPSSGTVLIDGENPYDLSPDKRSSFRADKIGFVFQQFHLIPYLTVLDNILTPSLAKPCPNAKDRAEKLIKRFKLENRKHHVPSALSTGERQRVALARALLNEPDLILADEPTGNLDKENKDIVLQHLADLASEGAAVLMVTHDDSARKKTTRSLHLNAGNIVEQS